jgi:hypothetical protein
MMRKMINILSHKRWIVAMMSAAVLVVAGIGTAIGNAPPQVTVPSGAELALPVLPSGTLAALFGALRAPAVDPTRVAPVVRSQLATAEVAREFGLALGSVRRVGTSDHPFYLVPGSRGLCLFLDDGTSVCSANLDALKRNGLSFSMVPAPSGRITDGMNTIGSGTITTYGIAPDGVASIDALTSDGQDVPAMMGLGAYTLQTDHPITTMSLHSAKATWQTVPGGANG